MQIVAITGCVACGKSTLLNELNKKFPTFNCDNEIAKLYQNPEIIKEIALKLPNVFQNGVFNKTTLKQAIINNNSIIKHLQSVLYPHLYKKIDEFCIKNRRKNIKKVFIEVPLVFENHKTSDYDLIIVIKSPIFKRKWNFIRRNNDANLWKIASQNQWPDAKKTGIKINKKKLEFFLHSTKFKNKEIAKLLKLI